MKSLARPKSMTRRRTTFPLICDVSFEVLRRLSRRDLDNCERVCRQWHAIIHKYVGFMDPRKMDVLRISSICNSSTESDRNESSLSMTLIPTDYDEMRYYHAEKSNRCNRNLEFIMEELRCDIREYIRECSEDERKCQFGYGTQIGATYHKCQATHPSVEELCKRSFAANPEVFFDHLKNILRSIAIDSLVFYNCSFNEHFLACLLKAFTSQQKKHSVSKLIFHSSVIQSNPEAIQLFRQLTLETFIVRDIIVDQIFCNVDAEYSLPWEISPTSETPIHYLEQLHILSAFNCFGEPIKSDFTPEQLMYFMRGHARDRFSKFESISLGRVEHIDKEFVDKFLMRQRITACAPIFESAEIVKFRCKSKMTNFICTVKESRNELNIEIQEFLI
ncbi:hypothetical protein DdX_03457 [Ditylenchus destructor]|uniref:F-box domain-containing protein n=1 Tax=Ditylenchus destructor TaxID=166010 RepID=A0AAD4NDN9_9BILA|nr:hypothetical protein DdX_03457 [Ditylenchus destructor]